MIIVSGGGPVSAFPSYFSSGKCSVVTVSLRPSQQALSMREVVFPRTLVLRHPLCATPTKHSTVTGELKSALAVNESWKPVIHESKKKYRETGLRIIAVNQSFVTAAGVCLSPGITGLSMSQAELARLKWRRAREKGYGHLDESFARRPNRHCTIRGFADGSLKRF